jgi:hypothetical protein
LFLNHNRNDPPGNDKVQQNNLQGGQELNGKEESYLEVCKEEE